jgi:hypothetical protein
VRSLLLGQVAPSRYEATLPGGSPGVYEVSVQAPGSGLGSASALLAVPYQSEYLPRPAADSVLGSVAAATNGSVLAASDPGVLAAELPTNLWWMLITAAGVLLLVEVALRMGRWRTSKI